MADFSRARTNSDGLAHVDSHNIRQSSSDERDERDERDKRKLQDQQEQYQQLQRDLADAISRCASLDDIRILLACGAKANNVVTQGLRPLHYAAYTNFVPAVRLLLLRGSDINATDDNGYTAVHLCAERGYRELLEFLIANGARVCFTRERRAAAGQATADEPLSMALKRGHLPCAELLLKAGADPNAEYFMGYELNLMNILDWRSIELLLRYGARPDSRDRGGLTPLMKAARHPQGFPTVKLLLDYGADPNDIAGERHDYRTVLHHSIFSGNLELIRLLLTRGARYPDLEQFDKPSPLDIAMISGRSDIVRLLIEFDANVNGGAQTTIGQPLHTALTQRIDNKREIVRLLLEAGADPNTMKTSNRASGPILADYLCAARHCGAGARSGPQAQQAQQVHQQQHPQVFLANNNYRAERYGGQAPGGPGGATSGVDLEIVRMLLRYGARVVLKTASQTPHGIVRVLERIQDELSWELLYLLVESAEQIDWLMMAKIIYTFLRSATRDRTNELFDPSVAADMTPERLAVLLANTTGDKREGQFHDQLVGLMTCDNGRGPTGARTLKQIARINIRSHLMGDKIQAHGHDLIERLNSLPLPSILVKYLLYET